MIFSRKKKNAELLLIVLNGIEIKAEIPDILRGRTFNRTKWN